MLKKEKKSCYAFYNHLLFLVETPTNDNIEEVHNDRPQALAWTRQTSDEFERSENESDDGSVADTYSQWPAKRKKIKKNDNENDNDAQASQWDPNIIKTEEEIFIPIESIPQNTEKNILQDEDDDRLFFLSLVKEFKKIPEHVQLQTKLNIMKVIQRAQCSDVLHSSK